MMYSLPAVEVLPYLGLDAALEKIAAWQACATQRGVTLRPAPTPPTTCCGRGCNGCVWEGFYDALRFWQEDAHVVLSASR